jgi:hypothetical protein
MLRTAGEVGHSGGRWAGSSPAGPPGGATRASVGSGWSWKARTCSWGSQAATAGGHPEAGSVNLGNRAVCGLAREHRRSPGRAAAGLTAPVTAYGLLWVGCTRATASAAAPATPKTSCMSVSGAFGALLAHRYENSGAYLPVAAFKCHAMRLGGWRFGDEQWPTDRVSSACLRQHSPSMVDEALRRTGHPLASGMHWRPEQLLYPSNAAATSWSTRCSASSTQSLLT